MEIHQMSMPPQNEPSPSVAPIYIETMEAIADSTNRELIEAKEIKLGVGKKDENEGMSIRAVNSLVSGNLSTITTRIPVELVWKNLNIQTKSKKNFRKIMHNVSGVVRPGQFLAIIGASGAGKTTLLNYLSGKMLAHDLVAEGETMINGASVKNSKNFLKFTAFVQQDDILLETLTVIECLEYAAELKFSSNKENRKKHVEELLEELELTDVKNLRFGGMFQKGRSLSRGEKKRVSIAVELTTNPSLLFLDEPTTSMDAFTAEKIVRIVSKLKRRGRTLIATIHQPNTEIYNQFDQLMIMSLGRVIFHNEAIKAVPYFDSIGYPCPTNKNPADFFMSLLSADTFASIGATSKTYPEFIEGLAQQYRESDIFTSIDCNPELPKLTEEFIKKRKYRANWLSQFCILCRRGVINSVRLFSDQVTTMLSTIIIGLLMDALYYKIQSDGERGFQDRTGVLFMLACIMVMGSISRYTLSFPEERAVLVREQASTLYDVSAYFVSKVIAEVPLTLFQPIILLLLVYWTVPLRETVSAFFICFAAMFMGYHSGSAYSLLLGAFLTDRESLISITSLLNIPLMTLSGFFVNLDNVVPILWPFQWISSLKYVSTIMLRNDFKDAIYNINGQSLNEAAIMDAVGVHMSMRDSFICLAALYLGIMIIAAIGLIFMTRRV